MRIARSVSRRLPLVIVATSAGLMVGVMWLRNLNGVLEPGETASGFLISAFPAVGALIAHRRP